MSSPNLHTLDSDVLYSVLILCPTLAALRSLIATHPAIYQAFLSRRRLVLKLVFRKQIDFRPQNRSFDATEADKFITRVEQLDPIAGVAFRESIWPALRKQLHSKQTLRWAAALLNAYRNANLKEEGLFFARQTMGGVVLDSTQNLEIDAVNFGRAVVRTYLDANLIADTILLQETIRQRIVPRSLQHSMWSKELVLSYRKLGFEDRILPLQVENWNLYKTAIGPTSDVALEWARAAVSEYKHQQKPREALQFWQVVRRSLPTSSPPYIAWSRYMMHMYKRQNQNAEALEVTEEVWRSISPEITGYRAWTAQLSEQYESAGRSDDAIAVCEAAWTAINERLVRQPNDLDWKYQSRGAGLMLAKVYRRYGRSDEANAVEERCSETR